MKAKKNPTKRNPKPLLKMVAEYVDALGFYHVENFEDKNIQEVFSKLARNDCRVVAINYIDTQPERNILKMSLDDVLKKIGDKLQWFLWKFVDMLGTAVFMLAIFWFCIGITMKNYNWNESILVSSLLKVVQNVPEYCYPSKIRESDFSKYVDEAIGKGFNATEK